MTMLVNATRWGNSVSLRSLTRGSGCNSRTSIFGSILSSDSILSPLHLEPLVGHVERARALELPLHFADVPPSLRVEILAPLRELAIGETDKTSVRAIRVQGRAPAGGPPMEQTPAKPRGGPRPHPK